MATEIIMPKLSDTMTEGQLGAWRKRVGDRIERGDIIAEVETDKAVMDLEAFSSGTLLEQKVKAGELVAVGAVIGLIGESREADAGSTGSAVLPVKASGEASAATPPPTAVTAAHEQTAPPGVAAAPVVRRRAVELGIDLAGVTGSGPGGRIMLEDLQPPAATHSDTAAASLAPPAAVMPPQSQQPLSRMRSAIARTTSSAWQSIPHFYLSRDVEMETTEQLIHHVKSCGSTISLNGVLMAAAAAALTRFPALNSCLEAGGITGSPHVNLGFAVALADGLQVPVIREAETKSVSALTKLAATLADRARQGTLTPADISGGSFTISNLGMYGIDALASIIMPGQAAILGLGTIADRPVIRNGQFAAGRVMTATLSCDHRIVDGATAAGFLNEWKRLLEQPDELPL